MTIRLINPCKNCFVYPVCREECKLYAEYYSTYLRLPIMEFIWIGLSIVQILFVVFADPFKTYILNYIPVVLLTAYAVLLKVKIGGIEKDYRKRFHKEVGDRVVYGFERKKK